MSEPNTLERVQDVLAKIELLRIELQAIDDAEVAFGKTLDQREHNSRLTMRRWAIGEAQTGLTESISWLVDLK